MVEVSGSAELVVRGRQRQVVGTLRIVARSPMSLFVLTPEEAMERGEEAIQLVEGRSYEYALAAPLCQIQESQAVQPSKLIPGSGRIEPGLATGLLPILIEQQSTGETLHLAVEVRSSKVDYHSDYRYMLDSIAEVSIGLLLDVHAPSQTRVTSDERLSAVTLHERFAFLKYILGSRDFDESMSRIFAMPHHLIEPSTVVSPIHRGAATGRAVAKAIRSTTTRSVLPTNHSMYDRLVKAGIQTPTLPTWVLSRRSGNRVDTPENRFVKHALGEFFNALMQIEQRLAANGAPADLRLLQEVLPLKRRLAAHLESDLLKQVGNATMLPLASPVLQRRGGYRELLQSWLKFNLAVQLSWRGADDVFGAGKKDVALLYEYWLFFVLLDVVDKALDVSTSVAAQVLQPTRSGFDLRLKSGTALAVRGSCRANGRNMCVRFSYNRTFPGVPTNSGTTYPRAGSWTRAMRPDFTLSLWPEDISEREAELRESMIHIHFDAKYRVEAVQGLFGLESEPDDGTAMDGQEKGRPVRSDLLKMHAYRDAIRRTEGAYVLYPGPLDGDHMWTEYHEIIPGLGAFAVRPGTESQAKKSIARFVRDVLHNASDPSSDTSKLRHALHNVRRDG